jgi:esterase/lipase superfamily enzyme
MGGAKAIVRVAVAVGCWGLAVASAPNGPHAAVLPAHSLSDREPADARQHGLVLRVQDTQALSIIIDDATGVRVGIPNDLVGPPVDRPNGREWNAPGPSSRLSINTLRFQGRSLEKLSAALSTLPGRTITRSAAVAGGFILEGTENKGRTALYVEVRGRGDEIRGLSIVYTTRYQAELGPVIEAMKKAFEAFPAAPPAAGAPPVAGPDAADLQKKLSEAEEREKEATRRAEEAKRQVLEAKEREAKAKQEEAPKRERERELAEWKQEVSEQQLEKAQGETRGLLLKDNPCASKSVCTLVPVFFGTDRKRADQGSRIDFGPERASTLQLGNAVVTVPRTPNRKVGEIARPSRWERIFLRVPPEGIPSKHFTILPNGVQVFANAQEFVAAVREHMEDAGEFRDHAFIFVHGYRTTFEDALYRVAQIAYDMAGSDGRPFGTAFLYSWPSGGHLRDYVYDAESAQFSVDYLREYVDLVLARSGAKHVHMIAHSMGNRPLLAVLDAMAKLRKRPTTINQVILAAPDLDAAQFARIAQGIVPITKGVTLYASANDLAMKAARKAYRGSARAGDIAKDGPVLVKGIDSIDISAISTDVIALGHAEYAERRELLNDIALLFRSGERPPHRRTPMYRMIQAAKGVFWRVQQ